jgi:hypothetical protein
MFRVPDGHPAIIPMTGRGLMVNTVPRFVSISLAVSGCSQYVKKTAATAAIS